MIDEDLIRVGLDTCVIRNLAYEPATWFATFQRMAADRFRFSLLDHVCTELCQQLLTERLSIEQFKRAVERADSFLDQSLPLLPGGQQLLEMAGILPRESSIDIIKLGKAIWIHLRPAQSVDDVRAPFSMPGTGGEPTPLQLRPPELDAVLEEERTQWRDAVKRVDDLEPGTFAKMKAGFLASFREAFCNQADCLLSVDDRLDLLIRHRAHVAIERNKIPGKRFNPDAEKRKNDGTDFKIGIALALPAFVCVEKKYYALSQQLGGPQSGWVFTPEVLAESYEAGQLRAPTFPSAAQR